jgi:phosphatidylserine/phosphatidylglycerophosphate/cardiolipin synthase-like enzyme
VSRVPPTLLEAIRTLAEELAPGTVGPVAASIADGEPGCWPLLRQRAQMVVGGPAGRDAVGRLLDCWCRDAPDLPPLALAAALEAAAHGVAHARAEQSLELVWTGPTSTLPLRRTAQALQQVIDAAERELLIVSYAVYKIPDIGRALARATDRGVALHLVIESPREVDGHVAFDGLLAFSQSIRDHANVYRWPATQRAKDDAGNTGALHVKCAVADERLMLLTSANLTQHALTLNMELGTLVRGGDQPRLVSRHFAALIDAGVLVRAVG